LLHLSATPIHFVLFFHHIVEQHNDQYHTSPLNLPLFFSSLLSGIENTVKMADGDVVQAKKSFMGMPVSWSTSDRVHPNRSSFDRASTESIPSFGSRMNLPSNAELHDVSIGF